MQIGDICTREVICANADTTVAAAAKLMRQYHIGDVVVVRQSDGNRIPLGIVTDRDIVLSVVATELDPRTLTVGDIMSAELATANEREEVWDAVQRMRRQGVRRMPIVDANGAVAGIVSTDDFIELLAEEMTQLTKLIAREQLVEQQLRR